MEVIRTKHPNARLPSAACLYAYPSNPPEMVPVDITDDVVLEVAGRFSGGAGPGRTDLVSLQHWFLRFGETSSALRQIVAEFREWLSNVWPPWDAYPDRSDTWTLVQRNQPAGHHGSIGGPWRPPIAEPFPKLRDNLP